MKAGRRGVPTLPVPLLRDSIAREVARMSLRHASRQIALSPNGLRNFLKGSTPRSATRVKLEHWLAAQHRVSRPPNVGQLVRLLREVAGDLAPQQVLSLGRDLAAMISSRYEERRLSPPRWLQEFVKRVRPARAARSFGRSGGSDVA
jgi:hypothetical protein